MTLLEVKFADPWSKVLFFSQLLQKHIISRKRDTVDGLLQCLLPVKTLLSYCLLKRGIRLGANVTSGTSAA